MVVDTGANVSISRKDLTKNSKLSIIWMPPYVSLQTVTGDKIQIHGKANVTLSNMHSKFEDITLFGLQIQFESNQKIIMKTQLSLSPRTECIPGLVAENRRFRFGLIDYPDRDSIKAGVLIASSEDEVTAACAPVTCVDRKCNSQDHSSDGLVKNLPQTLRRETEMYCRRADCRIPKPIFQERLRTLEELD
ncbi:retrovirus-related Pol polyprotein from transposon 412 [Trichonephila clavipes]|nr:retrovirus-related Pol polyprotein from transposon 412 [Trichonephila clavipes]